MKVLATNQFHITWKWNIRASAVIMGRLLVEIIIV